MVVTLVVLFLASPGMNFNPPVFDHSLTFQGRNAMKLCQDAQKAFDDGLRNNQVRAITSCVATKS